MEAFAHDEGEVGDGRQVHRESEPGGNDLGVKRVAPARLRLDQGSAVPDVHPEDQGQGEAEANHVQRPKEPPLPGYCQEEHQSLFVLGRREGRDPARAEWPISGRGGGGAADYAGTKRASLVGADFLLSL